MIKIAIIGTGGMANAHVAEFVKLDYCKITACSDIVPGRAEEFAQRHNIPSYYESTAVLLANEELDAVSIVTPDQHHKEPVLMAIDRGLHVMCEKPLAFTLADAREMAKAAKEKGIFTAVNFARRNTGSAQEAARIAQSGDLGRIMHVQCTYLQAWLATNQWGDWRETPAFLWRMSAKHGSAGALGDIGVHIYDLATFAAGDITEICCDLKTFKKDIDSLGDYVFDANDSFIAAVRFANGAIGVIQASRWCAGDVNTVTLKVSGDKGSLDYQEFRPDGKDLSVCMGDDIHSSPPVWKPVDCPETKSTYERFAESIRDGVQGQTSFDGAVKVQSYLEHSFISYKEGGFVKVEF